MKKSKINRLFAVVFLTIAVCFSTMMPMLTATAANDSVLIEGSDIPLRLHYNEEAPIFNASGEPDETGWQNWSLPVGNGYFGANVFGGTDVERIQITEKTLVNPYNRKDSTGTNQRIGGLNSFSETYIDLGHPFADATNYSRWLDLKTAIAGVTYDYNRVTYSREVFTSYPDKALVIKLDASSEGALDFTLRPTIPWLQDYAAFVGDGASKTGEVISYVDGKDGVVELTGKLGYWDVDFIGIYRVVTKDGSVEASTATHTYTDTAGETKTVNNGTIKVSGATSAYIYVNLGTDYELTSEVFTSSDKQKPTFDTTLADARAKVEEEAAAIAAKLDSKSFDEAYAALRDTHVADYSELFGRVTFDIGDWQDADITTDQLLANYKAGTLSHYLEVLYFQYGRYLLIASSRPGTLPANLQGVWNMKNKPSWSSGIWHNINVQMNYWPAFSTNIGETFEAYVGFNEAYMPALEASTTSLIQKYHPDKLGQDGGNGWSVCVGSNPFEITGDRSAGNLGFTTQLFWEQYLYTRDKTVLEENIFPLLLSAARFITKCVEEDSDGNYLVQYCDSPEMYVDGVWYYTVGTTYAQTFAYLNNYNALLAAKELGIDITDSEVLSPEEYSIINTILTQIDKYDPIIVGLSGQIKEFREEDYYCSVGDEPQHRHISQLVGLYPGNIINSDTHAWIDAAIVTLTERGDGGMGWSLAHKMNLWARIEDGERAYDLYNVLLKSNTYTNLWNRCPPFQIDGNLGGTAGVSEMLLQSHMGYIAPLAALPSAWSNGSYTGLVARGNFEVSAAWANGTATTFNITSKSGGVAKVYYPSITGASVVTTDGETVNYTTEGKNLISFDTEIGKTYIISGFNAVEKLDSPEDFTYAREDLEDFEFSWKVVSGAESYNVYIAKESAPTYTLLGNTGDTTFTYSPIEGEENIRVTFAITAVSADDIESKRAVCYSNPVELAPTLESYEAYAFDTGEILVTVKASDNTEKYRLMKKAADGTYTVVSESAYPIIIAKGCSDTDEYAISLISKYYDTESEIYVIDKIGAAVTDGSVNASKWYTNIFEGKSLTENEGTSSAFNSNFPYAEMLDGKFDASSRFSTKLVTNACVDVTVELDGEYLLSELRFYDYDNSLTATRLGNKIEIYAYCAGEWSKVYSVEGISNITSLKAKDADLGLSYVSIDLSGVKAEAVRAYAINTLDSNGITFYEMTCSGAAIPETNDTADIENILLGKEFVPADGTTVWNSNYGYPKITDGSFANSGGRFSTKGIANAFVDGTVQLGGVYCLSEMRIYDYDNGLANTRVGDKIEVYAYYAGEWAKVYSVVGTSNITSQKVKDTALGLSYVSIDLSGVKAEALRVYTIDTLTSGGITFYEITCSGSEAMEHSDKNVISESVSVKLNGTTDIDASVLTDKNTETSYSSTTGESSYYLEFDLGEEYELHTLNIRDVRAADDLIDGALATRSDDTYVELYINGSWVRIANGVALSITEEFTVFDLCGLMASKIRIGFNNTRSFDNGTSPSAVISEINLSVGIPSFGYIDAEKYPFFIFKDGEFVGAYTCWADSTAGGGGSGNPAGALLAARNLIWGDSCTIVLRRDYAIQTGKYDNLSHIHGTINIDLQGYTLTTGTSNLFAATAKKSDGRFPTFVVNNGTILMYKGAVLSASTNDDSNGQEFSFTFNNVNFGFAEGSTVTSLVYSAASSTQDIVSYCDIAFNECIFDFVANAPEGNLALINLSASTDGKHITDTYINGGTIKLDDYARFTMANLTDGYDTLTFVKADGKHLRVEVTKGSAAPMGTYMGENGNVAFKKTSGTETTEIYELVPEAVANLAFTPMASITLDSNLIFNIYLPSDSGATIKSVLINGVAKTLGDVNEDGYYIVSTALEAKAAAKTLTLVVTLDLDDTELRGTFEFSTVKYADKLLKSGATEVEKTLAKDMLAYVKSAYNYFNSSDKAEVAEAIEAVIGNYTVALNRVDGAAASDANDILAGTTFALDSTPAIRFYLHNGSDASQFSFKVGGRLVSAEDISTGVEAAAGDFNGYSYVDISLYAYRMIENVTITKGANTATYHINYYYDNMNTTNAAQAEMITAFYNYCVSANAYRNSVMGK